MRTITARELRNDSAQVLRELQEGESFEITLSGASIGVLRLDPPSSAPQRLVSQERRLHMYDGLEPLTLSEREAWKRDIRDAFDDEDDDPYERAARRKAERGVPSA